MVLLLRVLGTLLLRIFRSQRGLNGKEVEKMRGVWKAGSKGGCRGQRSLGGSGGEPEAASQQCGRFGKQELEVNLGTASGYFVYEEGAGKALGRVLWWVLGLL